MHHTINTIPAEVRDAILAANDLDTDRFVACFGAAGEVDDHGTLYRGRREIRRWSDRRFIGAGVILSDFGVVTEPDGRIAVHAQLGGHGITGPTTLTFTLSGPHISLLRITG